MVTNGGGTARHHGRGAGAGAGAAPAYAVAAPTDEGSRLRAVVEAELATAEGALRDLRDSHERAPVARDSQGRPLRCGRANAPSPEVHGPLHYLVGVVDDSVARLLAWDFGRYMTCVFTRHARKVHSTHFK